ncbi:MAG: hypothetical protein P4L77_12150 [Sulfuriferula sp.]|nr:hypothetical protein [Sulfuriferula sp.]
MFVYYQHHRDAAGTVLLTELKLSSSNNKWDIAFFSNTEKAIFQLLNPVMKQPPAAKRSCDMKTYVWTYLDDWGVKTLKMMEQVTAPLGGVKLVEVDDLAYIASCLRFDLSKKRTPEKPQDFFYNYGKPIATPTMTKETIKSKLLTLLEVSDSSQIDKKSYRRAALRLHPDRNNGDGSRMSELNMLWGLYNG